MIHNKFRYLLTLVALFAISTGAWADYTVTWEGATLKSVNVASYGENNKTQTIGDITVTANLGYFKDFGDNGVIASSYETNGLVFSANAKFISVEVTASSSSTFNHTSGSATSHTYTVNPTATSFALPYGDGWIDITKIVFTLENAPEPPVTVAWDASTKTGTFSMPGSDVELTPIYAPAAKWATEGDAVLAPTAIEGVIAGTDAPLIVEGTVVTGQGTVMYFATTEQLTAEQAAAADGWLSTLPTAANIADDGATVYVWYYIKGTDTPDGQEATAENTFNDSEICAQPLEVIVLSNKFDITFNAANANTIEAGKATVKVGDADATVTEGKLQGVKMGTKVTINAKQGYKFRKVEVKKGGAAAALSPALENGATVVINYVFNNYPPTVFTFTNNNGTYSCNITGTEASNFTGSLTLNGSTLTFSAVTSRKPDNINLTIDFDTASDTYSFTKKGNYYNSHTVSVNGTDITSQLTEEK